MESMTWEEIFFSWLQPPPPRVKYIEIERFVERDPEYGISDLIAMVCDRVFAKISASVPDLVSCVAFWLPVAVLCFFAYQWLWKVETLFGREACHAV